MERKIKTIYPIGEVSKLVQVDQHVIRFWTSQFDKYIKPVRKSGNRRYYNNDDIIKLKIIKHLLYDRGISIKGVLLLFTEDKNIFKNPEKLYKKSFCKITTNFNKNKTEKSIFIKNSVKENYENKEAINHNQNTTNYKIRDSDISVLNKEINMDFSKEIDSIIELKEQIKTYLQKTEIK